MPSSMDDFCQFIHDQMNLPGLAIVHASAENRKTKEYFDILFDYMFFEDADAVDYSILEANGLISYVDTDFFKAHPVVPGSPICGMRMPCGDRLRRAREDIEWVRAIGVSTVPRGPKGRRTATGMPTSGARHPKTGNPAPFQISPATPICCPHRRIAVYASPWSLPSTAQHSLPGGRYTLPGPDFRRLDLASFLAHIAVGTSITARPP